MRKKHITITLYKFDELSEVAKNKAISNYIEAMIECVPYEHGSKNFKKAIKEADRMQTPWFLGSYVFDYCKKEIKQALSGREFYDTGEVYPN